LGRETSAVTVRVRAHFSDPSFVAQLGAAWPGSGTQ
jgi:hypothetical protein